MEIVKVRRVGNSNVMSVPRSFVRGGYEAGQAVIIEQLETGQLLVSPVESHREALRAMARKIVRRRRGLLERFAAHDRGEGVDAAQAEQGVRA
jgi:antitoxin component of MazEF toxin-antitoxin module